MSPVRPRLIVGITGATGAAYGLQLLRRARALGADPDLPVVDVVLPIGISFYTFNSMSYTIDVYRGVCRPARNAVHYAAFVSVLQRLAQRAEEPDSRLNRHRPGLHPFAQRLAIAAPLAMVDCGHSITDSTLGLQWHLLGMFAPSFITGSLITRFGVFRIMALGFATIIAAALTGIAGITVAHFWVALALLGIGWNFAFIGATTLVTQAHRPEERNKVQSFNDFLIFGTMALGSFASGKVLATLGWVAVNEVVFPPVLLAVGMLGWLVLRERRRIA